MDKPHSRLSISRSSRLKSPREIRRVFHRGSRLSQNGYSVHWLGNSQSRTRLAFVVSRHSGKAHQRNRIKRRLREAARLNRASWPPGVDLVVRARGDRVAHLSFVELGRTMRKTLEAIPINQVSSPLR